MIKGRNYWNFRLLFLHFPPALHPRHLLFSSSWFCGLIPGITWALESCVNHSNRLTTFLLPWLHMTTDVKKEILPAAQHPNQHRKMFQKSVFFTEKAHWKIPICKDSVYRAAAAGSCIYGCLQLTALHLGLQNLNTILLSIYLFVYSGFALWIGCQTSFHCTKFCTFQCWI